MNRQSREISFLVYFLLAFNINLYANNTDNTINSYWNRALVQTDLLWDKTKAVASNTIDGTKNVTANGFIKSKDIFSKGKRMILEKALLVSLNGGLDYNDTIKVNDLSINDENSSLSLVVKLDGEDKELSVEVNHFDWDIIKNKEFIILENIDVSLDIAWLDYILQEYLKKHNGYIKVKYSLAKETFLRSLKGNIKTTYLEDVISEKEKTDYNQQLKIVKEVVENSNSENLLEEMIKALYDEAYINPVYIKKNGESIESSFSLAGNEKDFLITLESFDWTTANEKRLIVVENIKLKDCNKPWIASVLQKYHEQILIQYNPLFEEILTKIKPKIQK